MNPITFPYHQFQTQTNNNHNSSNNMQMPMHMNTNMNMHMNMTLPMAMPSMPMNPGFSLQLETLTESLMAQSTAQLNAGPNREDPMTQSSSSFKTNMVSNDGGSSSAESSVPAFIAERKLLGHDFIAGPYDVICARGAAAANHPGNLKFRKTIKDFVPQYAKATTKLEKSLLVTAIVDSVRDFTPDGGFVKKFEDGQWYEVGDACAREKIGQTLRDALHQKYKSSTKAKKPRRKELKALKKKTTTKITRTQTSKTTKPALAATDMQAMSTLLKSFPPAASHSLMHSSTMPPLLGGGRKHQDDGELNLTSIFSNALDEGLNLDSILRC